MKKQKRKTENCLNCGFPLKSTFEYCPQCGQENTDNQISFGKLIKDFLANYFSLDSRFGRSIRPFFLKPGTLTREFMEGKRVKYANPIRLYLVVSLIHFFFFSINMDGKSDKNQGIIKQSTPDSTDNTPTIVTETEDLDSLDTSWPISGSEWKIINRMAQDKAADYSIEQIEDSIHNEQKPFAAAYINRQIIKLTKSDMPTINRYIVKNIPILMFFLLPVYALLLKVFFRKGLYINHIIHSLHLHSFAFIALTFLWILGLISPSWADTMDIVFLLAIMGYLAVSFKNTYQLGYMTAIYKVFLSGFLYTIIMGLSLFFGVVISLLFY